MSEGQNRCDGCGAVGVNTMSIGTRGRMSENLCDKCFDKRVEAGLRRLDKRVTSLAEAEKMAKQKKVKKPLVEIGVKCPHCNAEMAVKVYREKVSPPNPEPEYGYIQDVQLTLPGLPVAEPAEVTA